MTSTTHEQLESLYADKIDEVVECVIEGVNDAN